MIGYVRTVASHCDYKLRARKTFRQRARYWYCDWFGKKRRTGEFFKFFKKIFKLSKGIVKIDSVVRDESGARLSEGFLN